MFNSVPIDVVSKPKPAKLETHQSFMEKNFANTNNGNNNNHHSTSFTGKEGNSDNGHNGHSKESHKFESLERSDTEGRVKILLKYLRRFGVPEKYLFDLDDLIEMKNMPKVTRCVAMLAKMVRPYQHLPHTRRG